MGGLLICSCCVIIERCVVDISNSCNADCGTGWQVLVHNERNTTMFLVKLSHLTCGRIEWLRERTEYLDIFLFSAHQSCPISNVLFTGGKGVSDFSVLKY